MNIIKDLHPDDCIFCKIASKAIPADLCFENDDVVAFPDIHPQAPTHILIIPKQHIPSLREAEDPTVIASLFMAARELAKKLGISDDGFRCVMNTGDNGGQTVYHIHLHLLAGRFMTWPPG